MQARGRDQGGALVDAETMSAALEIMAVITRHSLAVRIVRILRKVCPFTAKWHQRIIAGTLEDTDKEAFRKDLSRLQMDLRNYTRLLAAGGERPRLAVGEARGQSAQRTQVHGPGWACRYPQR